MASPLVSEESSMREMNTDMVLIWSRASEYVIWSGAGSVMVRGINTLHLQQEPPQGERVKVLSSLERESEGEKKRERA